MSYIGVQVNTLEDLDWSKVLEKVDVTELNLCESKGPKKTIDSVDLIQELKLDTSLFTKVSEYFRKDKQYIKHMFHLRWLARSDLSNVAILVVGSYQDNAQKLADLYNNADLHGQLPSLELEELGALCWHLPLGNVKAASDHIETEYPVYVDRGVSKKDIYIYLTENGALIAKARLVIAFKAVLDTADNSLFGKEEMLLLEKEEKVSVLKERRKNRQVTVDTVFDIETMSATFEEYESTPKAPIYFTIANDGVKLAYNHYKSPSGLPSAVLVHLAMNTLVNGHLSIKLAKEYSIESYVLEVRGFGNSGGPRGDCNSKTVPWADLKKFMTEIRYQTEGKIPIFLFGYQMSSNYLYNYAVWPDCEPADGYIYAALYMVIFKDCAKINVLKNKSDAISAHVANIAISRLTQGRIHGNRPALSYQIPENLLNKYPLYIGTLTNNYLSAISLSTLKKTITTHTQPMYVMMGDQDELSRAEQSIEHFKSAPNKHNKYEIVKGHSFDTGERMYKPLGDWILDIVKKVQPLAFKGPDTCTKKTLVEIDECAVLNKGVKIGYVEEKAKLLEKHREYVYDLPCLMYIDSFGDGPASYRHYHSLDVVRGVLVFFADYYLFSGFELLCQKLPIDVYHMHCKTVADAFLRGSKPNLDLIFNDIRLGLLLARANYPNQAIILGAHGLMASFLILYASRASSDRPNAYMFLSPFISYTDSRFTNAEAISLLKIKNAKGVRQLSSLFYFNSAAGGEKETQYADYIEKILKKTFKKDMVSSIKSITTLFGIWYGANDDLVHGKNIANLLQKHIESTSSVVVVDGSTGFGLVEDLTPTTDWVQKVVDLFCPHSSQQVLTDLKRQDFEFLECIGRRQVGRIWVARYYKNGKIYIVKEANKSRLAQAGRIKDFIRQRDIFSTCDNPFIATYKGSFQDDKNLYIIMEYLIGGEVYTLIRLHGKLKVEWARFYSACILLSLQYLHNNNIVHRNIKTDHIMISALGYPKLSGFKFSRKLESGERCKTFCGSLHYTAPEMITSDTYGFEVDAWGFGVLIFELLTGRVPFSGKSPTETYQNIINRNIEWPSGMDATAKSVINKLLVLDPGQRIKLGTKHDLANQKEGDEFITKHPWFSGFDWNLIRSQKYVPPYYPEVKSECDTGNFLMYSNEEIDPGSSAHMADSSNSEANNQLFASF